jgi:hypothetical protein
MIANRIAFLRLTVAADIANFAAFQSQIRALAPVSPRFAIPALIDFLSCAKS